MSEPVLVRVTTLPHFEGLALPAYETPLSAGMDLRAAVPENEPVTLQPGQRALVPAGIAIALPPDYEAQVRPRSGLAAKHGVTVLNAPGTIDSDYRGELKILLVNLGQEDFRVRSGDRIAQLVVSSVVRASFRRMDLEGTPRGSGGFGSTGV